MLELESSVLIGGCFTGAVRDRLKGHAVQTLINLGRDLQNLHLKSDSIQQKELLGRSLMEQLCLTQQVRRNTIIHHYHKFLHFPQISIHPSIYLSVQQK